MDESNIKIKIDYLSVTFPLVFLPGENELFNVHETVRMIANYLNVRNFEIAKQDYATNRFKYQYMLGENITLRLAGPTNDLGDKTCQLELKGEGCRDFERRNPEKSWNNLFVFISQLNGKFKRIDIAIDDFKGEHVKLDWLLRKLQSRYYTSIFNSSFRPIGTLESGLTINFGNNKSLCELCIYDKKMQQKVLKRAVDEEYWVRYEMRFRGEKAEQVILSLFQEYQNTDEEMYGIALENFACEQLYGILDIKEDNRYSKADQKKAKTDINWTNFLNNVKKGKLAPKIDAEASIEKYFKNIEPQAALYMIIRYLLNGKDQNLFEMAMYKLMYEHSVFRKDKFQRLNLFLDQMNCKTLSDEEMEKLRQEFFGIVNDRELPF